MDENFQDYSILGILFLKIIRPLLNNSCIFNFQHLHLEIVRWNKKSLVTANLKNMCYKHLFAPEFLYSIILEIFFTDRLAVIFLN